MCVELAVNYFLEFRMLRRYSCLFASSAGRSWNSQQVMSLSILEIVLDCGVHWAHRAALCECNETRITICVQVLWLTEWTTWFWLNSTERCLLVVDFSPASTTLSVAFKFPWLHVYGFWEMGLVWSNICCARIARNFWKDNLSSVTCVRVQTRVPSYNEASSACWKQNEFYIIMFCIVRTTNKI